MPFWKPSRTLEESQEDNERLEVELSIEQKRAAIKKLKESGLTPKSFGGSWRSILAWLRTH